MDIGEVKGERLKLQDAAPQEDIPTSEVISSAFRRHNSIGSAIADVTEQPTFGQELRSVENTQATLNELNGKTYNPMDDVPDRYRSKAELYVGLEQPTDVEAFTKRLDRETQDLQNIEQGGWIGTASSIAAGVLDPVMIPFMMIPALNAVRAGSIMGNAARIGAGGGLAVGASEVALQATQYTRTAQESIINTTAGALLGGVLGGLLGKVAKTRVNIQEKVASDIAEVAGIEPKSLSAAGVEKTTLAQEELVGTLGLAKVVGKMIPKIRLAQSPSVETRRTIQELFEQPLLTKKNEQGIASEVAVSTRIKAREAQLGEAIVQNRELYMAYRGKDSSGVISRAALGVKDSVAGTGGKLSYKEFNEAVGVAINKGVKHDIPEVQAAAQHWNEKFFKPYLDEEVELGLLERGIQQTENKAYLTRLYNHEEIIAKRKDFRSVLEKNFGDSEKKYNEGLKRKSDKLFEAEFKAAKSARQKVAESYQPVKSKVEFTPSAKKDSPSDSNTGISSDEIAINYSRDNIDILDTNFAGTGIKGEELKRLDNLPSDSPIKKRMSFYVNKPKFGKEVKEAGLGNVRNQLDLSQLKILDARDGLPAHVIEAKKRIIADNEGIDNLNAMELAINEFYHGYVGRGIAPRTSGAGVLFSNAPIVGKEAKTGLTSPMAERMLNPKTLEKALAEDDYVLMSPENPDAIELPALGTPERAIADKKNAALREEFKKQLEADNISYIEISGKYGNPENSFMLLDMKASEGVVMARRWKQESIATKDGLFYRDGRIDPSIGKPRLNNAADDFYSEITMADGSKKKFQIEIDFNQPKQQEWAKPLNEASALSDAEIRDAAEETIDNILGTSIGTTPRGVVPDIGVFKERALDIPFDDLRPWINTDIEEVSGFYNRTAAPSIELQRKFGSIDMEEQLFKIKDEYRNLKEKATDTKEVLALDKLEKADLRDLQALRDITLNRYGIPQDPASFWVRTGKAVRNINFISMLGSMTPSAIPDMARPVMLHGLKHTARAVSALIRHPYKTKMAIKEARKAGVGWDLVFNSTAKSIYEVGDPYARGNLFERGLRASADTFGIVSLMAPWNTAMKSYASLVTMDAMIAAAAKGGSTRLANLGIDKAMSKRIAEQFAKHGETDGMNFANIQKWNDKEAADAFNNALLKDVDTAIVTPDAADKPLMMSTEAGKQIGQFKTFAFGATSRMLLLGLQQNDVKFYNGLMLSFALGSVTYGVKNYVARRELTDDPMVLLGESIDRSGFLGIYMEMNNMAEKLTGGTIGLSAITGGGQMSRYASRNITGALLGPSAGTIQNIATTSRAAFTQDINKSDVHALRKMLPYQNLFYIRRLLDHVEKEAADKITR